MLRDFLKDAAIYGATRAVVGCSTLLLLPVCTNALTTAEYGIVDLLINATAVATVLVTLEISQGFARLVSDAKDAAEKRAYFSTAFWFSAAAAALFTCGVAVAGGGLGRWLLAQQAMDGWLLILWGVSVWCMVAFTLVQVEMRFSLRPMSYAVTSISYVAGFFAMVVIFIRGLQQGPSGYFAAQAMAALGALGVGIYLIRDRLRLTFDPGMARRMLRFSLPLVPSSLAIVGSVFANRWLLQKLMAADDLGVYAAGSRIASVVTLIIAALQMALTPLIYDRYQQPGTPQEIDRVFRWFIGVVGPLALFAGTFAPEIVGLLAPAAYANASGVVFVLALGMLVMNFYAFAPGLWIARLTGTIAIINLTTLGLSLVFSYLLIPAHGIYGAALAQLLAVALGFVASVGWGQRLYRIPYSWHRLLGGLVVLAAAGFTFGQPAGGGGDLGLRIVAFAAASAVLLLVLIPVPELRSIVSDVRLKRRGWAGL